MGRHRSDPIGLARLVLIGGAVVFVLVLVAVGAKALFASLDAEGEPTQTATSSASPGGGPPSPNQKSASGSAQSEGLAQTQPSPQLLPAQVPTVHVRCVAPACPVFVRVPGGDILVDRQLTKGEETKHFEPELELVLNQPQTVDAFTNGQPVAKAATRLTLIVKRK